MNRNVLTIMVFAAVTSLLAGTKAGATPLIIDNFSDPFQSETFIGSYGTYIGSLYESPGLEVGYLNIPVGPDHDDVGETPPSATFLASEMQLQTGLAGVLGGKRTATLTYDTGGNSRVSLYNGMLYFSNGAGAASTLELVYDGSLFDLSHTGGFHYLIDPDHVGLSRPTVVSMTLNDGSHQAVVTYTFATEQTDQYSYDSNTNSWTQTFNVLLDLTFTNADFLAQSPSLDLTHISSVALTIQSDGYGNDMSIKAVPEPASLGLLALGGLALIRRRRHA